MPSKLKMLSSQQPPHTVRHLGSCRQPRGRVTRWPGANLFRNPFGELTRSERAELAVVDLQDVLQSIQDSDRRALKPFTAVQLIGECGRGKTTRLLALLKIFPRAAYVYLPEDQPCPPIPDGHPLLIDEAQRMPRRVRRAVLASGSTLVLATHKDLTRPLRHAGYQVQTRQIGASLSPLKLTEILNRRIQASRRDAAKPAPTIRVEAAAELIRRFGSNVRSIESYLYDIVQSQVDHQGEMRFID